VNLAGVSEEPGSSEQTSGAPAGKRGRKPVYRWLSRLGAVVLALVVILLIAAEYVAHNAEPMLRHRVISELERRFHSPVELDELHISVVQGLQVSGGGLRILYLAGPTKPDVNQPSPPPMLMVKSFQFRPGIRQLFEPTMRIVNVYVEGLQLNIPPKQDRQPLFHPDDPKKRGQPKIAILVDKIICKAATVTIETSHPNKPNLVFAVSNVTLTDAGLDKPLPFDATLVNPKPTGDIHSTGHIGPWQSDNPRDTPIDGNYTFTHADLDTIKGIGGTLSSTGFYHGQLGQISVAGTADVPDFSLDVSEHPVPLHTVFDASVDGTTGDTTLNHVHATMLHTVFEASGSIIRTQPQPNSATPNYPGHDIELKTSSNQGRVEDILRLAAKTSPPLMHGALTFHGNISIKPGPASVAHKMQLRGNFTLHDVGFTNPKFQQTVDAMSERAQGHPKQANAVDAQAVTSQMSGNFSLGNAVVHLPDLKYQIPGALVSLAGDYSLDGEKFEFGGTVRTDATASQMLTGWKSLLAKPFDGLLKKNGAGVEVPIKVSGTKSDPHFGVDMDKMKHEIFDKHKDQTATQP
jgi:hypothetical protein